MSHSAPLLDAFGRVHSNLRISVTDRCNIRCFYCMPNEAITFQRREELLTFEEITRFVKSVTPLGIDKIRLTGGEPLVRSELPKLIAQLASVAGVRDIAMTTNGMLLAETAGELKRAGLNRLNISLDALDEQTFRHITRRDGLHRVLQGVQAAIDVGFDKIRLNAVAIRGITEFQIEALAEFALQRALELRFIEFMPLDADGAWDASQVLSGEEIRERIQQRWGEVTPAPRDDASQPAVDYHFANGAGRVGFINPVSQPFCGDCNRLRLTSEGQVRNCLFSTTEWDARALLRSGASDDAVRQLVRDCVAAKKAGHGIDSDTFIRPERAMYQIGG